MRIIILKILLYHTEITWRFDTKIQIVFNRLICIIFMQNLFLKYLSDTDRNFCRQQLSLEQILELVQLHVTTADDGASFRRSYLCVHFLPYC